MDLRPALAATLAFAAQLSAAAVGLATAEGDFKLNNTLVRGNATLSDGALVETLGAPSRLSLPGGASARLNAGSRARVYTDRLVIESGSGEFRAPQTPSYAMEARSLRIEPEAAAGEARLRFSLAAGPVQLSASRGRLRVLNATGTLVSQLAPGLALAFEPQTRTPEASAPSSFIGCVVKKDGKWMLYDPALRILVELRGMTAAVEREWGNRVQANGTTPATGQPQGRQAMDLTTISLLEEGGCAEMAKAVEAEVPVKAASAAPRSPAPATSTPKAPGAAAEGMSAGTKYAIIGAVAGGGVAGIVAATSGDKRSR